MMMMMMMDTPGGDDDDDDDGGGDGNDDGEDEYGWIWAKASLTKSQEGVCQTPLLTLSLSVQFVILLHTYCTTLLDC